ncbi:MAG: TetR family transcriptional regulator [Candidatus Dormibacteria bacterium]
MSNRGDLDGGLRERKKRETRQRISDIATALFIERGFDEVTVAEVAVAAGVSKVTVFNYFPRKEQLFFDRGIEGMELLEAALRSRAPGTSVTEAVRRLILDLAAQRHPLSGLRDGVQGFWLVVAASPTLVAAARAELEALEADVAGAIAEAPDAPAAPVDARLLAGFLVSACRFIYLYAVRRLLGGESADDVYSDYVAVVNVAFDMLAGAARSAT